MSLILVFHNDQKEPGPLREDANYNVAVFIGDGTAAGSCEIARGRVDHHQRSLGWATLVRRFMDSIHE